MREVEKVPSSEPLVDCCVALSHDDALQTWKQMVHTFLKLQRRIEDALAPHGLALSQFEALAKVAMNPGVIQQDLVKYLLVSKGNVGALVDRLEESKLIERRPDPSDRRANRLYLTESGAALVRQLFQSNCVLIREMMSPLTPAKRAHLRELLKIIEPQ